MELNKYMCAPGKKYENNSCFTFNELMIIIDNYNILNKNKIKVDNNETKHSLLKKINNAMMSEYNCKNNDQMCWLKTKIIKDKNMIKNTFRPSGPNKKYEWLSTIDINKVMKQYEKQYTDFKFFEAVPYDFAELPQLEVYNINFTNLQKNNINKIGMIINLDEHYMSGSHWVALYCVLNENKLYYFDSFGKPPGKKIKEFYKKILTYMKQQKGTSNIYDIRYNKIQHQFKNSECGVYSMNFIIRLLNNESFDHIINNITKDDKMNDCRNAYFINVNMTTGVKNLDLDYCTITK